MHTPICTAEFSAEACTLRWFLANSSYQPSCSCYCLSSADNALFSQVLPAAPSPVSSTASLPASTQAGPSNLPITVQLVDTFGNIWDAPSSPLLAALTLKLNQESTLSISTNPALETSTYLLSLPAAAAAPAAVSIPSPPASGGIGGSTLPVASQSEVLIGEFHGDAAARQLTWNATITRGGSFAASVLLGAVALTQQPGFQVLPGKFNATASTLEGLPSAGANSMAAGAHEALLTDTIAVCYTGIVTWPAGARFPVPIMLCTQ